jgi:hypothetical protein
LSEENLSISALANLCENLKISLAKADSSLSEVGALPTGIFLPIRVICFFIGCRRWGKFGLEVTESSLSLSDVGKEIKVVIEKV